MALYLKTQESSEEIGRILTKLFKDIEKKNKHFSVLESKDVSRKRLGDYTTSIRIGNDIFDVVVQGSLTRESKELLINEIGYERNMNIWFYRTKGNLEGYCFPITESETKITRHIGSVLIGRGKAERATLAIPKDRIKKERIYEEKEINGKKIEIIGNLKGLREDYDFEHFHS